MTLLSEKKYDVLCKKVAHETFDPWCEKTEIIFKTHKIQDKNDLMLAIAFAYSWIPTVPKWRGELDWARCKEQLKRLQSGNSTAIAELFRLIVPSVNNSIIGTSKALHFVYPELIPIVDSNVVKAWRSIFNEDERNINKNAGVARFPLDFGKGGSRQKVERHIDLYLQYRQNLIDWSSRLNGVSTRDIERKLFLYGRIIES
ncbi:hypothetical protein D0B88_06170 [Cellvibrio sp. KY-YJ-3]|nr:hypothetical protein D0B88_06170 [Cellvibrio sp. KY-YJ-3]